MNEEHEAKKEYIEKRIAALEVYKNLKNAKIVGLVGIVGMFIVYSSTIIHSVFGGILFAVVFSALIYYVNQFHREQHRLQDKYRIVPQASNEVKAT